jgi:hypothetical protein
MQRNIICSRRHMIFKAPNMSHPKKYLTISVLHAEPRISLTNSSLYTGVGTFSRIYGKSPDASSSLEFGTSAVTYNPHFPHFASPYPPHVHLGAVAEWPQVPALLVIDFFDPQLRRQVLKKALAHSSLVWVLRQHGSPDSPDLTILNARARILAELPKKSLVMHWTECWEAAAWDVKLSRYTTQIWRLNPNAATLQQDSQDNQFTT